MGKLCFDILKSSQIKLQRENQQQIPLCTGEWYGGNPHKRFEYLTFWLFQPESLLKPKEKSLVLWHTMRVRPVAYGPRVHSQLLLFPALASVFAESSCSIGFHFSLSVQKQLMLILLTIKIPFSSCQTSQPLSNLCSHSKTNITKHNRWCWKLINHSVEDGHAPGDMSSHSRAFFGSAVLTVSAHSWLTWKGSRYEQPEKASFLTTTTTLQRIIFSTTKPHQHPKITTQVSKREFKLMTILWITNFSYRLSSFTRKTEISNLVQSTISFLGPSSIQISLYKHRVSLWWPGELSFTETIIWHLKTIVLWIPKGHIPTACYRCPN